MASLPKKRRKEEDVVDDGVDAVSDNPLRSGAVVPAEAGFLEGLHLFLHVAALSKTRRSIFERQIAKKGGILVKTLEVSTKEPHQVLVLLEDSITGREKLAAIVDKLSNQKKAAMTFVGLSWLSKCLEKDALLSYDNYVITGTGEEQRLEKVTADDQVVDGRSKVEGSKVPGEKSSTKSYMEGKKHKFVCAQSSENPAVSTNLNKHITDQLEKLAVAYKSTNDTWRAFGYQKAISALRNYPRRIDSREEASKIPNVGRKMADKIMEIVEEGSLQKVAEVCEGEKVRTVDLFNRVWGVGPATAERLYEQGLRTLEDLKEKGNLNKQQQIGLKHFADLDERMTRSECTEIYEEVKQAALGLQAGSEVIACGSYRRGKETCGDLDILITHHNDLTMENNFFERLLTELHGTGFLTDDLSRQRDGRQQKYLGVCKLMKPGAKHRRLDIIVVPFDERAPALMYFTGSAHFNRSMRLLALKMGMSLSEHGLVFNVVRHSKEKLNEGAPLPTPTEESIFEHFGLPYRAPCERNH